MLVQYRTYASAFWPSAAPAHRRTRRGDPQVAIDAGALPAVVGHRDGLHGRLQDGEEGGDAHAVETRARARPAVPLVRRAARLVPRLGLGAKPSLAIPGLLGGGLGAAAGAPHPGHTTQGMHVWQLMGFIELSLQRSNLQIVPSLTGSTPASMGVTGRLTARRTAPPYHTFFWHWLCAATRGGAPSLPRAVPAARAPSGSTARRGGTGGSAHAPCLVLLTRARSLSLLPQVSRRALSLTKTPKAVSQRAGQRGRMSSKAARVCLRGGSRVRRHVQQQGRRHLRLEGWRSCQRAPPIKAGDAARLPRRQRGSACGAGARRDGERKGRRQGRRRRASDGQGRDAARAAARGGGRQGRRPRAAAAARCRRAAVRPRGGGATAAGGGGPAAARRSRRRLLLQADYLSEELLSRKPLDDKQRDAL